MGDKDEKAPEESRFQNLSRRLRRKRKNCEQQGSARTAIPQPAPQKRPVGRGLDQSIRRARKHIQKLTSPKAEERSERAETNSDAGSNRSHARSPTADPNPHAPEARPGMEASIRQGVRLLDRGLFAPTRRFVEDTGHLVMGSVRRRPSTPRADTPPLLADAAPGMPVRRAELDAEVSTPQFQQNLRQELIAPPSFRTFSIKLDFNPSVPIGIKVDQGLIVTFVDRRPFATALWDKVKENDVVRQVNGVDLRRRADFNQALEENGLGPLTLTIDRPRVLTLMSPTRVKYHFLDPNPAMDRYITVYLVPRGNRRVDIVTKQIDSRRLLVMKVKKTDITYGLLEPGDIILDVDGRKQVRAEELCGFIRAGMSARGYVSLALVRAMMQESIASISAYFDEENAVDPQMKYDAAVIGRIEALRRRFLLGYLWAKTGILKGKQTTSSKQSSISIGSADVVEIMSDVPEDDWEDLHPVPKDELNSSQRLSVKIGKEKSKKKKRKFYGTRFLQRD